MKRARQSAADDETCCLIERRVGNAKNISPQSLAAFSLVLTQFFAS